VSSGCVGVDMPEGVPNRPISTPCRHRARNRPPKDGASDPRHHVEPKMRQWVGCPSAASQPRRCRRKRRRHRRALPTAGPRPDRLVTTPRGSASSPRPLQRARPSAMDRGPAPHSPCSRRWYGCPEALPTLYLTARRRDGTRPTPAGEQAWACRQDCPAPHEACAAPFSVSHHSLALRVSTTAFSRPSAVEAGMRSVRARSTGRAHASASGAHDHPVGSFGRGVSASGRHWAKETPTLAMCGSHATAAAGGRRGARFSGEVASAERAWEGAQRLGAVWAC